MHHISIIDGLCSRPYDERSLPFSPMDVTESAVVLLAEALSCHYRVDVVQHCRVNTHDSLRGVHYRGRIGDSWHEEASGRHHEVVIIINSPKIMTLWRRKDAASRIILWRHDCLGKRQEWLFDTLFECDASMVCVSNYHQRECQRVQKGRRSLERIHAIPNPVQVHRQVSLQRDPDRLLYCSSSLLGLEEVLQRFREVRASIPSLQLRICNPSCLQALARKIPGIVSLGSLSRPQMHAEMMRALCLFCPQTNFTETSGLVAAEANALGTPVLAYADRGALSEALCGEGQLVGSVGSHTLLRRLQRWRNGKLPRTGVRRNVNPAVVADCWSTLIRSGDVNSVTLPSDLVVTGKARATDHSHATLVETEEAV